ncbi:major capsid protein [Tortoise microvirus 21]|nr:major capsid protein [Tortoise microvirus 21]
MKPFQHVEMFRPNRSVFNRSRSKLFDCDMGQLIPVFIEKVVPGDKYKIGNEIIVRVQPMIAPILHEVNVFVHTFFVPLRLLWPKPQIPETAPQEDGSWEDYWTGGKDGMLELVKPKWIPQNWLLETAEHSLWDYCDMPVNVTDGGVYPDAWPRRAYNFIWNEYYRDQNYMDEVDFDDSSLKYRCWEKDYFTTALPWQQRGQAPALPVEGYTEFLGKFLGVPNSSTTPAIQASWTKFGTGPVTMENYSGTGSPVTSADLKSWFDNNQIQGYTFDVNDLRLAFQTQKFLERNARAGARYVEQLRAHFGVSPRDDRMQRPEYIGGTRSPLIVSEVLQTSSTDATSPQGNLAGHGMTVDRQFMASYYVQEYGIIMSLMSIMPRPVYQQGIDRVWLGDTRYDELLPEFVALGEQPIYGAELYYNNVKSENESVFGFQGRYDEYRVSRNTVCGIMRSQAQGSLAFWHLARDFSNRPQLNSDFLLCKPRKDWLAVPDESAFIVNYGSNVRAVRPLPVVGTPGLIDHF